MNTLDLRVPPVAVAAVAAALMWGVARRTPRLAVAVPGRVGIAVALASAGAGVALAGVVGFRRARTTVNPVRPGEASALVTSGVYRASRNPMYVGFGLALLGWATALAHPLALLGAPAFGVYLTRFQIVPEERALRAEFGPAFEAYARRVRRWL